MKHLALMATIFLAACGGGRGEETQLEQAKLVVHSELKVWGVYVYDGFKTRRYTFDPAFNSKVIDIESSGFIRIGVEAANGEISRVFEMQDFGYIAQVVIPDDDGNGPVVSPDKAREFTVSLSRDEYRHPDNSQFRIDEWCRLLDVCR